MAAYYPISAYTDSLGMSIYITFESMSSGGAYQFGLGLYNNPANAKVKVNLSSPGFTNGVAVTKSRSCVGVPCERPYATGAMRLAYPSQSVADEVVSGSNIIIRIALSEFIYAEDTSITVDVGTGFYTQGGNQSQSVTSLSVTNNSTNSYSSLRVIGNNASPQCETVIGTTLYGEISAFHKFGIDCIKVSVSDGTNTVNTTVTDMVVSPDSPLSAIIVYPYTFNLTSLNDNSVPTVSWVAYPNIGTSSSILNTNDGINTFPTALYTNLNFRLDKIGDHGHACVDVVNGNDSTGAVYSNRALAESGNAYLTVAAALTALQTYHNTNSGHNDAGGGTIYHKGGTLKINTTNGGTLNQWVTITPATGVSKASAVVQAAINSSAMPRRLKLSGVTFSGTTYFSGASRVNSLYLHNCSLATSGSYTIGSSNYSIAHNCTGYIARTFLSYGTETLAWGLIRGCNMSTHHSSVQYCILGNKNVGVQTRTGTGMAFNDNLVYAYNESGALTYTSVAIDITLDIDPVIHGMAIIQNLLLRYTDGTQPLCNIASTGGLASNNIIMLHNTFAGERFNAAYNTDTITINHANWTVKNNYFAMFANKDDVFIMDSAGIGGWPVGYHVGCSGNLTRSMTNDEWNGEFHGLYSLFGGASNIINPMFVTDNTFNGANTSGGDYHLQATSPAIGLAHELVLPYDFEGNTRTVDNAAGVYRYSSFSVPVVKNYFRQMEAY